MGVWSEPRGPYPVVMQRPNGSIYHGKLMPKALLLEDDGEVNAVLVVREDEYQHARDLAQLEADRYDHGYVVNWPRFGWYRQTMRNNEPLWEIDEVRGAPGYLFQIVEK